MANVSIPNLPPVIALSGAEQFEVVQNGTSARATLSQITSPTGGIFVTKSDLAASSGAGLVGYNYANAYSPGTLGYYDQQEKCLKADFGAKGDNTTDDTAAINAALASGYSFRIPSGVYRANNLTGSTGNQKIRAIGNVVISKNANGPLLTHSGSYIELNGIQFVGDNFGSNSYTGDNVVLTGTHPRVIFCGSTGTPGRALKATGGQVQVYGTCSSYSTTDTTASGYDIEIGISGTATLYHDLHGIYTSQRTGGILLIDTGTHSLVGGQIGKLTIQAGTSPAGVNGGKTVGVRIIGDVSVGVSNAVFTSNQFGLINFTIQAGVTGTQYIGNLEENGFAFVNNANLNQLIMRNNYQGGADLPVKYTVKYGADSDKGGIAFEPSSGTLYPSNNLTIRYGSSFTQLDNTGANAVAITVNSSANATLALSNPSAATYGVVATGTGGFYVSVGGSTIVQVASSGFRPQTDNSLNLGSSSQRWFTTYTTNVKLTSTTVAGLSAAGTIGAGARAFVSDSTVAASGNFGAIVAGGGANAVPVFSDGTNWRIG